jgi:hypothetical protein
VPHEEQRSEAALLGRRLTRRRRQGAPRASALRLAGEGGPAAGGTFTLDRVQRWLQAVIVHPGDVEEALAAEDAARELAPQRVSDLVRPSHSLSAAERVDIYHGMYMLRMVEALEADYPAVRHVLGEEAFQELIEEYVGAYPSRSYTLNRLGDHLPRFLEEHPERPRAAFLADLARLELAVTQVFDEEDSAVLTSDQVRAVPADRWPMARVRPVRAFRLLTFEHPVLRWLDAARRREPPPVPVRRSSRVVVYRQRFSVLRLELSRPEHALLAALAAGSPLAEAVAAAAAIREKRREAEVFSSFRTWVAEGMFAAIEM